MVKGPSSITPGMPATPPLPKTADSAGTPIAQTGGAEHTAYSIDPTPRMNTSPATPLTVEPGDDSLVSFEAQFRSLTTTQQHALYSLSAQMGHDLCKNVLKEREKLLEGDEDVFSFPFATVPLANFDRVNAIFAAMERAMHRAEATRFVIDATVDTFVFGTARCYAFKEAPVVHFTDILESKIPHYSEVSSVSAFVLQGKDTIFVLDMHDESRVIKMRESRIAKRLWEAAGLDSQIFEKAVMGFNRFKILAHEYGHILSFKDPAVASSILNPIFRHGEQEYPHPSYQRFYDMGEVYAELFGVMDALVEKENDALTVLAFAYYARNLQSQRMHGRTNSYALMPLFLKNVHYDPTNNSVSIDYEGFRQDIDERKSFFYRQFKIYESLSADEIDEWIRGFDVYMMTQTLARAVGVESIADASKKPSVEAIFRDRVLEELGLSVLIPFSRVQYELQKMRDKNRIGPFNESFDELEETILRFIPGIAHTLTTEFAGDKLKRHVDRSLGFADVNAGAKYGVDTRVLPSLILDVNELMKIERKVEDHATKKRICEKGIKEDDLENHFGESYSRMSLDEYNRVLVEAGYMTEGRMLLPSFDGRLDDFIWRRDVWHMLRDSGYIDNDGIIQPTFDGNEESFVLPEEFECVREDVFRKLKTRAEWIRESRQRLLSDDELGELTQQATTILNRHFDDAHMTKLAAEILNLIIEARHP